MASKKQNPFAGKKAAPFTPGGGRSPDHPNTAKGKPRKKKKSTTMSPPASTSKKSTR